jgi:hypothetical protein
MTKRRQTEATVLPVHFEDRSGAEFERLCFAYLPCAVERGEHHGTPFKR